MTWIQNLLGFFYDIVFGCRHWSQTRPFTLEQQTYKVCLDCGKQIYYSPERMTPLSAREVRRMKADRRRSSCGNGCIHARAQLLCPARE